MVLKGYKKPLTPNDMWDLRPENQTENVVGHFDNIWIPTVQRKQEEAMQRTPPGEPITTDINLAILIVKEFWPQILFVSSIRFVASVLTFASPLVLDLLIGYMSPKSTEPHWRGYFYASLMFVSPLLESTLNGQYEYMNSIIIMKMRSCIINTIYKKVIPLMNRSM